MHNQLSKVQQNQLNQLLHNYEEVFKEMNTLPPVRSHDHKIVLKDGIDPVSVRPYRYPFFQKNAIEELVNEMLKRGVIRPSSSPFSALVVLVKKRDNSWR